MSQSVLIIFVVIACLLCSIAAMVARTSSTRSKKSTHSRTQLTAQIQQEKALSKQLVRMLNGDSKTAQWMFYKSKENYPDKAVVWHLEQVIQAVMQHLLENPSEPLPSPPIQQRRQPAPHQQPVSPPKPTPQTYQRDYRDYRDN